MAELAINHPAYQLHFYAFAEKHTERSVPNESQRHPMAFQSH
jgi:hypothetical protein